MAELTAEQAAMVRACLDNPAHVWVTALGGKNDALLREWEANGWVHEVEAPIEICAAFQFTPAGRRALGEPVGEPE